MVLCHILKDSGSTAKFYDGLFFHDNVWIILKCLSDKIYPPIDWDTKQIGENNIYG